MKKRIAIVLVLTLLFSGVMVNVPLEQKTAYVVTVKFIKSKAYFNTGIMTRAYAKLSDGSIIYSDVQTRTIYSIADELYQKKYMRTEIQHNYLYEKILSWCNPGYQKLLF